MDPRRCLVSLRLQRRRPGRAVVSFEDYRPWQPPIHIQDDRTAFPLEPREGTYHVWAAHLE